MGVNDTAQANVALQFDPQQDAIKRRIDALKATTQGNEAGINQWGQTGQGAINNTYDTLDAYLGKNRTDTGTQLQNAAQQQGAGWDQAVQAGVNRQNDTRSYMENLANRTGMQAALPSVMTGLENSQNQINQINGNMAQNQRGNMQNWATMMDSILGQGQNIAKQTRATKSSDFQTQLLKALSDNKLAGVTGENDLQGRLLDVLGQRGNALVSELDRLGQQEWQRQLEQAKLDQGASIANANLGAENARLGLQRQQMDNGQQLDIMKMLMGQKQQDITNQQWDAQFGLDKDKLGMARNDPAYKALDSMFSAAVTANPAMTPLEQQQLYSQLSHQLGLGGIPGIDNSLQQLAAATGVSNAGGGQPLPPQLGSIPPPQKSTSSGHNLWGILKSINRF